MWPIDLSVRHYFSVFFSVCSSALASPPGAVITTVIHSRTIVRVWRVADYLSLYNIDRYLYKT